MNANYLMNIDTNQQQLWILVSMAVTTAALAVGYESPLQFTREYRRLFGPPPLKDIKAVRGSSVTGEFGNN